MMMGLIPLYIFCVALMFPGFFLCPVIICLVEHPFFCCLQHLGSDANIDSGDNRGVTSRHLPPGHRDVTHWPGL